MFVHLLYVAICENYVENKRKWKSHIDCRCGDFERFLIILLINLLNLMTELLVKNKLRIIARNSWYKTDLFACKYLF